MNKKINIIILVLSLLLIPNVHAYTHCTVINAGSHPIKVRCGNYVLSAYCQDPGGHLSKWDSSASITCGIEPSNEGMQNQSNYILSQNLSVAEAEAALRMAAMQNQNSHFYKNQNYDPTLVHKYEEMSWFCNIEQYRVAFPAGSEERANAEAAYAKCGSGTTLNTACIPSDITQAQAQTACNAYRSSQSYSNSLASGSSSGNTSGGNSGTSTSMDQQKNLIFTETGVSASGEVTISVTSTIGPLADMRFECGADDPCTFSGSGTSWTIKLQDNGDCKYDIDAFYTGPADDSIGTAATFCQGSGQYLIIPKQMVDGSLTTTPVGENDVNKKPIGVGPSETPKASYSSNISPATGGEYYKVTCDGQCGEEVSSTDNRKNEIAQDCGKITSEDYTEKVMVNCCDDENGYVSWYRQAKLTQVMCETQSKKEIELGLEKWDPKCGAKSSFGEELKATFKRNVQYCQQYCTDRVGIEIPGQMNGEAGMYFQLKNLDGLIQGQGFPAPQFTDEYPSNIYSPYIIGVRRCRNRIDYQAWRNDYTDASRTAMKAFNEYQKFKAEWDLLDRTDNAAKAKGKEDVGTPGLDCKWKQTRNCKDTIVYNDANGVQTGKDENDYEQTVGQGSTHVDIGAQKAYVYRFDSQADIKFYQIKEDTNNYKATNFIKDVYPGGQTTYQGIDYILDGITYTVKTNGRKPNCTNYNAAYTGDNHYETQDVDYIMGLIRNLKTQMENTIAKDGESPTNSPSTTTTNTDGRSSTSSTSCGSASAAKWTCTYDSVTQTIETNTYEMSKCKEDRIGDNGANGQKKAYANAVTIISDLEADLTTCNKYYDEVIDGGEARAEEEYMIKDPKIDFKYTQVYYDQTGTLVLDASKFPFANAECKFISSKTVNNEDTFTNGIVSNNDRVGANPEILKSFGGALNPGSSSTASDIITGLGDFNSKYRNGKGYEAPKIWGEDIYIQADCYFPLLDKPWQTLYPNAGDGVVNSSVIAEEIGNTGHYKVITTYMSAWEGSYETVWSVSGLGRQGEKAFDFEKKFNEEASATCSNQNVNAVLESGFATAFTCKLRITKQITQTEGCPPDDIIAPNYTSAIARAKCCKNATCPTVDMVIKSTIVDPTEICPTGTNCDTQFDNFKNASGNWNGAYREIQKDAENDKTYSPENLSYAFTLTPSAIRTLKNESRGAYGTTSGSNSMTCVEPSNNKVTGIDTVVANGKCKSNLITEIANSTGSGSKYYGVWSSTNKPLSTIRSETGGNVHWAWCGRSEKDGSTTDC